MMKRFIFRDMVQSVPRVWAGNDTVGGPIVMLAVIMVCLAWLTGCAAQQSTPGPMPAMNPVPQGDPVDPAENPGSLYSEAGADYLFSDNRARRVGDIVLVSIVEDSKAKNKADTTADRTSTMDLGVENFFMKDTLVPVPFGSVLGLKGNVGPTSMLKTSTANTFEGEGETNRESTVTATVAARVVRLLPGGLMQVEGAREVRVNEETQILVVRGVIRPRDISSDNTILSTHIADSRIEYYGKGVIADKQKPGWLSRLLEHAWPF